MAGKRWTEDRNRRANSGSTESESRNYQANIKMEETQYVDCKKKNE